MTESSGRPSTRLLIAQWLKRAAAARSWRSQGNKLWFAGQTAIPLIYLRRSAWGDMYYLDVDVVLDATAGPRINHVDDAHLYSHKLCSYDTEWLYEVLNMEHIHIDTEQREESFVGFLTKSLMPVIEPFGDINALRTYLQTSGAFHPLTVRARQRLYAPVSEDPSGHAE